MGNKGDPFFVLSIVSFSLLFSFSVVVPSLLDLGLGLAGGAGTAAEGAHGVAGNAALELLKEKEFAEVCLLLIIDLTLHYYHYHRGAEGR